MKFIIRVQKFQLSLPFELLFRREFTAYKPHKPKIVNYWILREIQDKNNSFCRSGLNYIKQNCVGSLPAPGLVRVQPQEKNNDGGWDLAPTLWAPIHHWTGLIQLLEPHICRPHQMVPWARSGPWATGFQLLTYTRGATPLQ